MKKKNLYELALIVAMTSALLAGCGSNTQSPEIATPTVASETKVETVTEIVVDEEGSTHIEEATEFVTVVPENKESDNERSESSVIESRPVASSKTENTKATSSSTNKNNETSKTDSSSKTNTSSKTESSKAESSKSETPKKPSSTNVNVSSVSLSKSSMSITVDDKNSFTVTINPGNATNKNYTVTTSNGNATVSCSGSKVTVYAKKAGKCKITVKASNGKSAACDVTVKAKATPKPTQITDDTPLTHAQLCTDKYMNKFVNDVINHFSAKGMGYITEYTVPNNTYVDGVFYPKGSSYPFDKHHTGWFFCQTVFDKYDNPSYNEFKNSWIEYLENEIQAILIDMYGGKYSDYDFNFYYEQLPDGEYEIYFCYG